MGNSQATNKSSKITNVDNQNDGLNSIKVMTWNIQGLLEENLDERTEAVVKVIQKNTPDVVLFQEVVPRTFKIFTELLSGSYSGVKGTEKIYAGYFTAIFYKKDVFKLAKYEIIPFKNSVMDRTLLVVVLKCNKQHIAVLTSHLESLGPFRLQRIEQLKECFDKCSQFYKDGWNVVFAGDLNLEDDEAEGVIPDSMKDVWIENGSNEEIKYTWDMSVNRNVSLKMINVKENEPLPRKRLDRMYFFQSKSSLTFNIREVELHGKEIVSQTAYFPSDHWALTATFDMGDPKSSEL